MSQMAAIVYAKKGQATPKSFLEKLLSEHQSGVSVTIVKDGIMKIVKKEVPLSIDTLMAMQEKFKDADKIIYLVDSDGKLEQKDIQPFVAMTEGPKQAPLVAVFAEGDFEGFEDESGATDAGNLFDTFLSDKLGKVLDEEGGDLVKFVARLKEGNGSKLKEEILETALTTDARQQGTLCYVTADSDIIVHARNGEHKHYDWGWSSRDPDAVRAEEVDPKEDVVAEADGLDGLDDLLNEGTGTPKPDENQEVEVELTPAELKSTGITKAGETTGMLQWKPGEFIKGRNKIRAAYMRMASVIPNKATSRPFVPVSIKKWEQTTGQKWAGGAAITKTEGPPKPDTAAPPVADPKGGTVQPVHIGLMDGAVKDAMKQFLNGNEVKKHLDVNSEVIVDPDAIEGLKNKATPFHEQMGLADIWKISQLPPNVLLQIGKTSLASLVNIAGNFRMEMLKLRFALDKANQTITKLKPVEQVVPVKDAPATPAAVEQRRVVNRAARR